MTTRKAKTTAKENAEDAASAVGTRRKIKALNAKGAKVKNKFREVSG